MKRSIKDDLSQDSRETMLQVAEQLFSKRGYTTVKIKDIAEALGKSQALVYHHFPSGKVGLYIAVTERTLERMQKGLESAIGAANDNLLEKMRAAARFLLSQPPMNFGRMIQSDMPALPPEQAQRLEWMAYRATFIPLDLVFKQSYLSGEIKHLPGTLDGMFLSIIEGVHVVPERYLDRSKETLADELIEVMYRGIKA